MNMENFITGYPGHESEHREAMQTVLGDEKYEFFFDKFLEYFFTEEDAIFFSSLGLNCLRLPFNYRHLEDDMNPRVLKVEGFKHLDRVIDLVSKTSSLVINKLGNKLTSPVRPPPHLHNSRYAHPSRRAKSRLALRQSHLSRRLLGPQGPPRPLRLALGTNRPPL